MPVFPTHPNSDSSAVAVDRSMAMAVCVPLVLVVLILRGSPNFRLASGPEAEPFGGDVIQEWIGGWIVVEGDDARLYDLDYARQLEHDAALVGFEWDHDAYLPMVYPPFWYLLVSPLALLPLTSAAVVWTLLMTACFVAAALVLRAGVRGSALGVRASSVGQAASLPNGRLQGTEAGSFDYGDEAPVSSGERLLAWGLPLTLLFTPLIESLGSGQKSTLLLLLFAATFVLLDRRRPFWAGVVFGLVAFKPQLTLVVGVAMLLKREWSFVAGSLTTGAALVGLSFLVGSDACGRFFELCAGMGNYVHTGGYDLHKAHCWWGACQLLLNGAPDRVVKMVAAAAAAVTISLLFRIERKPFTFGTPAFALQFSALTVATLLLSPHLFTYDLTLLLLPLFLIVTTAAHSPAVFGRQQRAIVMTAVGLFALSGLSPQIAASTGVQLTVLLMFALLWFVARVMTAQPTTVQDCGAIHSTTAHNTAPA